MLFTNRISHVHQGNYGYYYYLNNTVQALFAVPKLPWKS